MNDSNMDTVEEVLRDVFAHQAASADAATTQADARGDVPFVAPDVVELAPRRRTRTRWIAAGTSVAAAVAVGALVVSSLGGTSVTPDEVQEDVSAQVLAALEHTTAADNFDIKFSIDEFAPAPAPPPPRTPTSAVIEPNIACISLESPPPPSASGCPPEYLGPKLLTPIEGHGSVALDPLVLWTESNSRLGRIELTATANKVWLAPDLTGATTSSLVAFQGSASTLGDREGPVLMLSLASPASYLTLSQEQAFSATTISTELVDGVEITTYEINLSPVQMSKVKDAQPQQAKVIADSLAALRDVGYTGTTVRVGVGADGFIHSMHSTANFADSGTVTLDATFSKFGCASFPSLPSGVTPPKVTCAA